jgi:hypothetical protein
VHGFPERAYIFVDQEGVVRDKKAEDSPGDQSEVEEELEDLGKTL